MSKKAKIQVENPNEQPVEVIADAIVSIGNAMRVLSSSRLQRRAIVALIHDNSKIPKRTIEFVLNNLETLEATWLKPKVKS
jgi:hypothetical protein